MEACNYGHVDIEDKETDRLDHGLFVWICVIGQGPVDDLFKVAECALTILEEMESVFELTGLELHLHHLKGNRLVINDDYLTVVI